MKIADMNWMQVEDYLKRDDRCILPLGSTEQHAYMSLTVDCILAEKVAVDAAEPLGIPVYPVLPYGLAPYWTAYPGSVSLRLETYVRLVGDLLDNIKRSGFRRILLVNGHGGNAPAAAFSKEWMIDHPDVQIRFHNWYNAPRAWEKVQAIDTTGSHASWMENFPWTRLAEVALPTDSKAVADIDHMNMLNPAAVREYVGDGSMGGVYQRSDEEMLALWAVGVEETRSMLTEGW
jgi:creatinine amidohydrolase